MTLAGQAVEDGPPQCLAPSITAWWTAVSLTSMPRTVRPRAESAATRRPGPQPTSSTAPRTGPVRPGRRACTSVRRRGAAASRRRDAGTAGRGLRTGRWRRGRRPPSPWAAWSSARRCPVPRRPSCEPSEIRIGGHGPHSMKESGRIGPCSSRNEEAECPEPRGGGRKWPGARLVDGNTRTSPPAAGFSGCRLSSVAVAVADQSD